MDSLYSKANYERELQLTQVSENVLYQCLSVYLAGMLHILVLCALLVVSASFIMKHVIIVLLLMMFPDIFMQVVFVLYK